MYFKDITLQIKDKNQNKQIRPADWEDYGELSTLHLNPSAKQNGGFSTGPRVFGRTPKMPTGAAGDPFFAISRIARILQWRRRIMCLRI